MELTLLQRAVQDAEERSAVNQFLRSMGIAPLYDDHSEAPKTIYTFMIVRTRNADN